MTAIKARTTIYKGIQMRSRLEADYAAYLDQQGHRWGYEPECFASEDGQWLPDFGGSFADDGPFGFYVEVKPAGPLTKHIPGSVAFVEHADAFLRRMTVTWASRPDVLLSLVFWQYGGPGYLTLLSARQGAPWLAYFGAGEYEMELIWPGMGQYERCRNANVVVAS